jgi:hypothetical protein
MSGRARLWLPTLQTPDSLYGGPGDLYVREWAQTAAIPTDQWDDQVELWGDGPSWNVYRHTWLADGTVNIEMQTMVIDPAPEQCKEIERMARSAMRPGGGPRVRFRSWNITDTDTDPRPNLLAGGWKTYEDWKEERE